MYWSDICPTSPKPNSKTATDSEIVCLLDEPWFNNKKKMVELTDFKAYICFPSFPLVESYYEMPQGDKNIGERK